MRPRSCSHPLDIPDGLCRPLVCQVVKDQVHVDQLLDPRLDNGDFPAPDQPPDEVQGYLGVRVLGFQLCHNALGVSHSGQCCHDVTSFVGVQVGHALLRGFIVVETLCSAVAMCQFIYRTP